MNPEKASELAFQIKNIKKKNKQNSPATIFWQDKISFSFIFSVFKFLILSPQAAWKQNKQSKVSDST